MKSQIKSNQWLRYGLKEKFRYVVDGLENINKLLMLAGLIESVKKSV